MLVSFVYVLGCRMLEFGVLLARGDRSKELEIIVLRHELSILRRQAARQQLAPRDRLVLAALSRVLPRRSWPAFFVTPETLLRWHRRIVARRWTYPRRRPGRPPLHPQVRELITRLARENSHWGYVRIVGELRKLGISVSATLVRNVLARAGVPRGCPTFCVSGRSVSEVDLERKQGCAPVVGVPPALLGVDDGEVDQFAGGLLGREVSSGIDRLADLAVQRLDRVGIQYERR